MDFKLLQDAFEAVINSHYKGAVGKIALRLVECPAICSKALNLLSQLCPYSESDSGKDVNSVKQSALTTTTILFRHRGNFKVQYYKVKTKTIGVLATRNNLRVKTARHLMKRKDIYMYRSGAQTNKQTNKRRHTNK